MGSEEVQIKKEKKIIMNIQILFLGLAFLTLSNIAYSQEIKKETVKEDGIEVHNTITTVGMYGGTKSREAKKYFNKAAQYGNNQDFKEAKKYYLKALKEDDKYVEAYDNLGLVYRRLGEYDNAIKSYKRSIKIYPKGIIAHQNLASVYGIKEEYKNAIKEYEAILRISPNNPEGYFGIANSYMMLSQFDKALLNAKKALNLYEKSNSHHIADGYSLVGLIYYYKGDNKNAKKYLSIAKNKGAKMHPKIENEFFIKRSKKEYQLKTKEDYAKYEQDVIDGHNWLMKTPVGESPQKRKEISAFLVKWISGSPNITLELSEKILTYNDCADCLMIFMSAWTNYALETKDFNNKFKGNLEGTKSVIEFYKKNKKALGENKSIEKLLRLEADNKLEKYIKSNL